MLLRLENERSKLGAILAGERMFERTCLPADILAFLDLVAFLANRHMRQGKHVAAAEWSALIIFTTPEFRLLMKVVSDQAAAM